MDAAAKTAPAREYELLEEDDTTQLSAERLHPALPGTSHLDQENPSGTVKALALKHLDRFMSLEPKVLRGNDPDAIHDLRVASRRLQQVIELLYPAFRHGEIGKLRRKIRRARRALGEVRNADVQLDRVHKILARKRSARRETWESVRDYLLARRSEHFAKAVRRLGKLNLAGFYIHLKDFLAQDGLAKDAHAGELAGESTQSGGASFAEQISHSFASVWQGFEEKVAESHRDSEAAVIHGVRIAAKRLRYLIEVLQELKAPGSAEVLIWLRKLQELLGNWHDLEVLEQMLVEMVARPAYLRDNLTTAMDVERLILKNRVDKGRYREMYFQLTLEGADYRKVRNWAENLDLKIEG